MDLCILGPNINTMQFAAGYLLWIVILPLVVFIGETSVSPLWRTKTISSKYLSGELNFMVSKVI